MMLLFRAAQGRKAGTLVLVRALAMMNTAMFDAWTQYDVLRDRLWAFLRRRPASERTLENKQEAVSYAAYRIPVDLFPSGITEFNQLMITLGYDPGIDSDDSVSPPGIGLRAASAVLEYPHHDGSNQLGDLHPGAYSDYTGYEPVSADAIPDPDRWQSVREDGNSESSVQTFYMPQWRQVKPFGFDLVSDLLPQTGPRTLELDPAGYILQAKEIVELSNHLTEREKVIAEYLEVLSRKGDQRYSLESVCSIRLSSRPPPA